MIINIQFKNFKSLEDVQLDLGPINVLIGPNGSGKSSIVHALALLKQSNGKRDPKYNGDYIRLGSYEDVVYKHDTRVPVLIRIMGQDEKGIMYEYVAGLDTNLRHHFGMIAHDDITIKGGWGRERDYEISPKEIEKEGITASLGESYNICRPVGITGHSYTEHVSKELKSVVEKKFKSLVSVISIEVGKIFFVPALRGFDRPAHGLIDSPLIEFVSERGSIYQSERLAGTLAYLPELEEKISTWTERITGSKVRHRLVPARNVTVEALGQVLSVNIVNEGFGLNQLLFVLGQLAAAPQHSLIAIEEPELHLHPRAQAELAEIFVEVAKDEHKQLLITTHNEHVLYRLLTNVAEGRLTPQDLKIYYFEKKDTATKIKELKTDEKGAIEGGLAGFFEADIEAFDRYLKTLTRKSRK